jgi:hypothetical protein
MPDGPGQVWLRQSSADLQTAEGLRNFGPSFFCQVISKCQQAVEKAIKAIVADLQAGGVPLIGIGRKHDYQHGVLRFAEALIRIPRSGQNRELHGLVSALLNDYRRGEIRALDAMVPRRPNPGALSPLNTEYPYQDSTGRWMAPADQGSFDRKRDVERFRKLALKVVPEASKILAAIARRPS